nr:ATP-binding protein [Desulfonatronospira thiodismutans]
MEVENPGILLPGMTIEDMMQGISKIRNSVIARVFRELRLIEQWGSGIPSIMRQAQELGVRSPLIQEIGMRLRFTVFLPKPQTFEGKKAYPDLLQLQEEPELKQRKKVRRKVRRKFCDFWSKTLK